MLPDDPRPVHVPPVQLLAEHFGAVLDLVADRIAERLAVLRARQSDARVLNFAAIDADTLRNLLDALPDAPELAKPRQLAARIVEQLTGLVRR